MLLSSLIFRIISWAWKKSSFPTASSTRLRHSINLGLSSKMSQPTPTGCRKPEGATNSETLLAKTTGIKSVTAGTGGRKRGEELIKFYTLSLEVKNKIRMKQEDILLGNKNKGDLLQPVSSFKKTTDFLNPLLPSTHCLSCAEICPYS